MIYSVKGKILAKNKNKCIIGLYLFNDSVITLEILVPDSQLKDLGDVGESQTLFLSYALKDEKITFFGFTNERDKLLFDELMSLPKIGSKYAFKLFCAFNGELIMDMVKKGDIQALTRPKGIGKNVAKRIVFELSRKIPKLELQVPLEDEEILNKSVLALKNLGLSEREAKELIKKSIKEIKRRKRASFSSEELVKEALRLYGKPLTKEV